MLAQRCPFLVDYYSELLDRVASSQRFSTSSQLRSHWILSVVFCVCLSVARRPSASNVTAAQWWRIRAASASGSRRRAAGLLNTGELVGLPKVLRIQAWRASAQPARSCRFSAGPPGNSLCLLIANSSTGAQQGLQRERREYFPLPLRYHARRQGWLPAVLPWVAILQIFETFQCHASKKRRQ